MLPVVQISTFFLNADFREVFNGWLIIKPELTINLSTKCSGLMFFCFVLGSLILLTFRKNKSSIFGFLISLFAAYLMTILANSNRIILIYYVLVLAKKFLPFEINFFLHLITGCIVFLLYYVLIILFTQKVLNKQENEYQNKLANNLLNELQMRNYDKDLSCDTRDEFVKKYGESPVSKNN